MKNSLVGIEVQCDYTHDEKTNCTKKWQLIFCRECLKEKQMMNRKNKITRKGIIRMIVASPHTYKFDSSWLEKTMQPRQTLTVQGLPTNYPGPRYLGPRLGHPPACLVL